MLIERCVVYDMFGDSVRVCLMFKNDLMCFLVMVNIGFIVFLWFIYYVYQWEGFVYFYG